MDRVLLNDGPLVVLADTVRASNGFTDVTLYNLGSQHVLLYGVGRRFRIGEFHYASDTVADSTQFTALMVGPGSSVPVVAGSELNRFRESAAEPWPIGLVGEFVLTLYLVGPEGKRAVQVTTGVEALQNQNVLLRPVPTG
jgi:hypothetical protein